MRISCHYQESDWAEDFKTMQVVIGRRKQGAAVDLDLSPDTSVSRLHARVWTEEGEFWIEDLGSAWGTQVNGEEIKGHGARLLLPGDIVKIGKTTLKIQVVASAARPGLMHLPADVSAPLEHLTETLDANIPPYSTTESGIFDAERRLTLFYELPLQFGQETRLDVLLQRIVERLVEVIPGARRGALLVKEQNTGELILKAHVPLSSPSISLTMARLAMEQRRAFVWPPPSYIQLEDQVTLAGTPESVEENRIESAMYAPLLWQGAALGAVCVDNDELGEAFIRDDLRLLQAVAHHAAMSVANLELRESWRRQTEFLGNVLKLVSPQIAELLKQRRGRLRLGGEFREATILLSDIRGFTNLSATMSPDDVTDMLDDYFAKLVPIIFKHQGTIDKFVGDAILAVFGSPHPDEKQQLHAIRAAMEMQAAMREVNTQRSTQGQRVGQLGIGIHYGEVVHGLIGTDERMEFTVIGDAVNRASRYCDGAGGGEVIISPEVYQWVWKDIQAEQTSITTKHEGEFRGYSVNQLKDMSE